MMQYNQQSIGIYYYNDRKEPRIFVARWLCKSSHEKERDNSKQIDQQQLSTSPLNQQATNAIISQLSSPPNILTMSRILATPFLSYMLISEHSCKTNGDSSSVLSESDTSLGATQISDVAISEAATTATMDAVTTISTTNLGDQISSTPAIALSLFLIMAFTDFLDGHIARTYPSTATVLGTYLDPFADKFFISILSCTLCYTGTLPGMLVGLWVIRDVGMFGSAYWMVRRETLRNQNNSDSVSNIAIMDPLNTPLKVQASLMSKVNTTLQIGLIALGIAGDVPAIHIPPELMTSLIWVTAGTTIVSTLGYLDGSALKNSGNR
jgi:cardiolipin synthase